MTGWQWTALVAGMGLLFYLLFVLVLLVAGRREEARALAGFVPDCVLLFTRLARDGRVPRRHKLILGGLVAYLALPFDLVPDFIPVAGQLDDAIRRPRPAHDPPRQRSAARGGALARPDQLTGLRASTCRGG